MSPIRRWTGPMAAAVLVLTALLAILSTRPPAERRSPAGDAFSLDSAWSHIEAIARAPHPVGTAEHDRVRAYVLSQLAAVGLRVDTQTVQVDRRSGRSILSTRARNVMARLEGSGSTGAVLLVSHYDGVPLSLGAADDGIGVATMLETARRMAAGDQPRNDVIFLVTDAEEVGLLGAMGFAESHPWMDDVAVVLNFEARGTSGPALMFETGPGSGWAVRAFGGSSTRPVSSALFPEVYRRLPNDTDFTIFRQRGLPGLNFAIGESAHWYHTPGDRPENVSRASLRHMGDNALSTARRLATLDLEAERGDDPVFFSIPAIGLLTYPAGLAVPLAVLLVVGFIAAAIHSGRRRRLGWWGLPVGLLAAVAAVALAAGASYGIWTLVRGVHPEYGSLAGRALYREWPYVVGFVALAAGAIYGLFGLLRRWFGLEELSLGALLVPVGLSVAAAFWFVGGSYLFLWPSFLALAAVALRARDPRGEAAARGSTDRADRWDWMEGFVLTLTALVVLLLAPVVHLVGVFLGAAAAPVVAGVAGVLLILTLPSLDLLGRSGWAGRAWLPVLALLLAGVLVGWGAATADPAPERPAPGNVLHVQDIDRDRAVWASPVSHDVPFTDRFVGDATDTIRLGLYSRRLGGRYRVQKSPGWGPPPSVVTVLSEELRGDERIVRISLSADPAPMALEILPDHGFVTRLLDPLGTDTQGRVAEAPLEDRWSLLRLGAPGPVELTIAGSPGDSIRLVLIRHYPGLPALEGGPDLSRPAGVMATPAANGRSTLSDQRVVRETVTF